MKRKRSRTTCGHVNRKHKAHGLCRSCYDAVRRYDETAAPEPVAPSAPTAAASKSRPRTPPVWSFEYEEQHGIRYVPREVASFAVTPTHEPPALSNGWDEIHTPFSPARFR